ncbi:MAG: hypothetical protein KF809_05210 [Chloroflexi bacterium]|nr:hypothetical protein [Chloroflexota bacterium]
MSTWATAWRLYRFELVAALLGIGLLVAGGLFIILQLDEARPVSRERFDFCGTIDQETGELPDCPDVDVFVARFGMWAFELFGFASFAAGALLGSVLVSREIEHRTAQLGWSLSGARWRWLLGRLLPVGLPLLLVLVLLALVADAIMASRWFWQDPRESLRDYGLRGPPLVTRGLAVFAVSVLIGSVVGRQLPALLLAAMVATGVSHRLKNEFPYGVEPRGLVAWREYRKDENQLLYRGVREAFLAPDDGRVISYDEALAYVPRRFRDDEMRADNWVYDNLELAMVAYTGEQLTEIETREALILGTAAVLALGATFVVIGRRRPY